MKKFISLFIALIISACLSPSGGATPQVTVTSEVTVTLAPPNDSCLHRWVALTSAKHNIPLLKSASPL